MTFGFRLHSSSYFDHFKINEMVPKYDTSHTVIDCHKRVEKNAACCVVTGREVEQHLFHSVLFFQHAPLQLMGWKMKQHSWRKAIFIFTTIAS